MSIYIWEDDGFQDLTTLTNITGSNYSYYYGVMFTPNKNCSITKVKFLGTNPLTGALKIAQGNYASAAGTTYTITASDNPNCIYELSTPYQLTANTNYVVSFLRNNSGNLVSSNNSATYPVVCKDITYNYGTNNSTNTQITGYYYIISGLFITAS